METPAPVFIVFIVIAVLFTALSRLSDTDRVKGHIEERGGKLLEKKWTPFGTGWYGDHNRIYTVRYLDRDGNEHQATCKTNILSGVYWTDDEIVRYGESHVTAHSLQEENARLRQEIERLKQGSGEPGEERSGKA